MRELPAQVLAQIGKGTHMKGRFAVFVVLALALGLSAVAQQVDRKVRFADQVEAYLKADEVKAPPQNAILFIGSSIFRKWEKLTEQMAPLPVFNRAFGGSQTHEVLYYMDRLVLPYKPRIIAYYCGSNDINAKVPPTEIFGNFQKFVERVHARLPDTKIFFVSINRAPEKMDKWAQVDEANRLVKKYCLKDSKLGYIDVNPVLFDKSGQPRYELYLPDKLHFLEPAYVEFTAVIKPVLAKEWKK